MSMSEMALATRLFDSFLHFNFWVSSRESGTQLTADIIPVSAKIPVREQWRILILRSGHAEIPYC
jgi:hypothetical protein